MRLKKRINISLRLQIFIIVICILVITFFLLKRFSNNSIDFLYQYAENNSINISTKIISKSIYNEIYSKDIDVMLIEKNSNDEIINIKYDTEKLNKILYDVSNDILNSISELENSNSIFYVKYNVIYNTPILNNLGHNIPYKVSYTGSVDTFVDTKVTPYGINNSLIEVCLNIHLNVNVLFPFISNKVSVDKKILISSNVIEGKVPTYYGGVITNSSPIKSN